MSAPYISSLLLAAKQARAHDERARGSRAGTATAGGRLMLPVAMAESQPEYLTTYTLDDAGNVTQAMGQGYGYGTYGVDFSLS
jgi:hypothetical protein